MTTNKFSKYVIDNIVVGTPISSIIAAGATIGLDSAAVIDLIDSDYIQQRESSGLDSAEVIALIDSDYVAARTPASNGAGLDSAATLDLLSYGIQNVGSNQKQVAISLNTFVDPFDQTGTADRSFNLNYTSTTGMFVRETGGRTEIHADASGTGQSTGLLLTGASFGNNGTEIAGNLKLSSLPTSDPSESGLLWNDGGIPVFSGSTAPIVSESLDSADVVGIVDSAYVQARETPQDFAYSSLTGAPTALSSFTNDTNYITAADIPATVDSDYVAARAPAGGLDSAGVQGIVDDNILGGTANSGVVIGPSVSAASNRLQQTVVGPSAFSDAEYTVVMGRNARVESNYFQRAQETVAIGNFSRVGSSSGGYQSIAIGSSATSEKSYAVTIGANAVTEGDYGVSIGYQASADGDQSTALGYGARVNSGTSSVQVGRGTIAADNAIAISATGSSATTASTQYAIDIRTSDSGSVTYATDSDWVFGATVNAPAFVGDGSGLTGLPSGGGLDSAGVQLLIDDDLTGSGLESVQIGVDASATGSRGVAVGPRAAATNQNNIAIGNNAGDVGSAQGTIAIGAGAKTGTQGADDGSIAIGTGAGEYLQGPYTVAIGDGAGRGTGNSAGKQQSGAVAIGKDAGKNTQGENSVAIGRASGNTAQGDTSVAVGMNSQNINNAVVSGTVGVGYAAGQTNQGTSATALGYQAGQTTQGSSATALGFQAGNTSQGSDCVAIGRDAAFTGQASNSVAIGRAAGYENQGTRAIAIGRQAGAANQGANNIILNATSGALNRTDQYGIDIRTSAAGSLTYDTTNDWTFGAGVTMTDLTSSGVVIFSALPTADPVNAGQLWNDGGTLKVSAG